MEITILKGDIVEQDVDAVVNAANSGLMGGGGVDGAILRAGGAAQLAARRDLVDRIGSLPTGEAAWTDAGDMPARWVIHVVGPVHSRSEDRTQLLASCYRNALAVADELGAGVGRLPGGVGGHLRVADRRRRRRRRAHRRATPDRRRRRPVRAVQRRGPAQFQRAHAALA